jgi:predicted nucleotidyltransferase
MSSSNLTERIRDRARTLPAVQLAVLFGSVARGENRDRSDVDLGVWLEPDTLDQRVEVEAELGRAAGRPVDVIVLNQAPPLLRFEIARDGVLLLERREGMWTDFKARAMIDWWDWGPTARMIEAAAIERLKAKVASGPA